MGDSNGCSGPTNGAGGMPALDNAMLDNPRWRQEMCADAGVTRGWCAVDMSLSAYLAAASS